MEAIFFLLKLNVKRKTVFVGGCSVTLGGIGVAVVGYWWYRYM